MGVATHYPNDAFVVRSGSSGSYTYAPASKTVTRSGTQLCATVTETNTFFCPARVVTNPSSATSDTGSTSCTVMATVAQQQQQQQQQQQGATSPSANLNDGEDGEMGAGSSSH